MKKFVFSILKPKFIAVAMSLFIVAGFTGLASASHSWGGYHWARTSNPFTLKLGGNLTTPAWRNNLAVASSDWSASTVLDTIVVSGKTLPKKCRPFLGRVEICDSKYGNNGWLGIAQIWISGPHITQGLVKLNDTYFETPQYNTNEWKQLVVCQEVAHTLGLDHQDEDFGNANVGSCMDYTSNPASNMHPNQHDFDQLETIYAHLDTFNSNFSPVASTQGASNVDTEDKSKWGKEVKKSKDNKHSLFERNLGNGEKVITFVTWAD